MKFLPASILTFSITGSIAAAQDATVQVDMLCVLNASPDDHVFAVQAPGAGRRVQELSPGERLCTSGAQKGSTGVVSVYEHLDALEGCSRLVAVGRTEAMIRYVDFDRCLWSSNS